MIPIVSCYFNRGEILQVLSQFEYNSFIQIKEKPKGNNRTKNLLVLNLQMVLN